MNRYLRIILMLMTGSLVLITVVVSWIFSSTLGQARADAGRRMSAIAGYTAVSIQDMTRKDLDDEEIDRWLTALSTATGFERIVLFDSLGLVYWSGSSHLSRGDDIRPYVIDTACYERVRRSRIEGVSALVRIEGVFFQALYHPCRINNEYMIVMVQSDQNYLSATRQFRNNILTVLAILVVLLLLQTAALLILDRRVRQADQRLRGSERLAFLGRMSAELAHELKNPLAIIKSSADVLRLKYDPEKKAVPFTYLSEEIMRLSRLITDMLGFSQDRPLAREWIGLAALLDECIASRSVTLQSVKMNHTVNPRLRIQGDRDALLQVLDNLIRNAVHAMGGSGDITVRTEKTGNAQHLLVSDSGPGIAPQIIETLFEPFVSGSKTGTGLGLAIVKALCERSGWRIGVLPGSPTCFDITIPDGLWQESSL